MEMQGKCIEMIVGSFISCVFIAFDRKSLRECGQEICKLRC